MGHKMQGAPSSPYVEETQQHPHAEHSGVGGEAKHSLGALLLDLLRSLDF